MSLCDAAWEQVSVTERASVAGQHIVERVRGKVQYTPYFGQHPPLRHHCQRVYSSSSPTTWLALLSVDNSVRDGTGHQTRRTS